MSSEKAESQKETPKIAGREEQDKKFGYKAPESVYQKHKVRCPQESDRLRHSKVGKRVLIYQFTAWCYWTRKGGDWCFSHGLLHATKCRQESRESQGSRDKAWSLQERYGQSLLLIDGMWLRCAVYNDSKQQFTRKDGARCARWTSPHPSLFVAF